MAKRRTQLPATLPEGWREVINYLTGEYRDIQSEQAALRLEIASIRESLQAHNLRLGEIESLERLAARLETQLNTFNYAIQRLVEVHMPDLKDEMQRQIEAIALQVDLQASETKSLAGQVDGLHDSSELKKAKLELWKSVISGVLGGIVTIAVALITGLLK